MLLFSLFLTVAASADADKCRAVLPNGPRVTAETFRSPHVDDVLAPYAGKHIALKDYIRYFSAAAGRNVTMPAAATGLTIDVAEPGPTTVLEMARLLFAEVDRLGWIVIDTPTYLRIVDPCPDRRS